MKLLILLALIAYISGKPDALGTTHNSTVWDHWPRRGDLPMREQIHAVKPFGDMIPRRRGQMAGRGHSSVVFDQHSSRVSFGWFEEYPQTLVPTAASLQFSVTTPTTTSIITPSPVPGSNLPKKPTYEMFCAAVDAYSVTRAGGHPPKPALIVYRWYQDIVARNMSLDEQVMFLANVIWESGGLQFLEEIACKYGGCAYGKYYGRGYIQLTWDYNYRDTSYALYGDDRLLKNPSLAAQVDIGWQIALYYWREHVTPRLREHNAIVKYLFGYTIKAINGAVECKEKYRDSERLRIYNEILARWNITTDRPGKMTGCLPDLPPIVSRCSNATMVTVPTTLVNSITGIFSVVDPNGPFVVGMGISKITSRPSALLYG
jgi:hypothetical protein